MKDSAKAEKVKPYLDIPGSSLYKRLRLSATFSLSAARLVSCPASGKRKGPA